MALSVSTEQASRAELRLNAREVSMCSRRSVRRRRLMAATAATPASAQATPVHVWRLRVIARSLYLSLRCRRSGPSCLLFGDISAELAERPNLRHPSESWDPATYRA